MRLRVLILIVVGIHLVLSKKPVSGLVVLACVFL